MQRLAVLVAPDLFGVVLGVDVDGARAPIVFLAWHIVAPFEQQNAFAGRRQGIRKGAASCSGAYDDHIETLRLRHMGSSFNTRLSFALENPSTVFTYL